MGPAVEAGQLVRDFLAERIQASEGELKQMQDGVEGFIHRCMVQFSTPQPSNGSAIQSGADYRMPARTAEEIKATMAAEQGAVTAAKRGAQLTDSAEVIHAREGLADPAAALETPTANAAPLPAVVKPEGWIL